jgi:hypothetical protein
MVKSGGLFWNSYGKWVPNLGVTFSPVVSLTEQHMGEYLAGVTADCIKRFGLENKVHTLAMDNASNCDATASGNSLITYVHLTALMSYLASLEPSVMYK